MPRILKINNVNLPCFTPQEADRIPNIMLGKNCRIHTNMLLKCEPKYSKLINDNTMGALDNYAEHEKMDIYITPLENDMFNDLKVSVFKKGHKDSVFPINIPQNPKEIPEFFKELYTKIHESMHTSKETPIAPKVKKSQWKKFTTYIDNAVDRIQQARFARLRKIAEKHQNNSIAKLLADTLAEIHYGPF